MINMGDDREIADVIHWLFYRVCTKRLVATQHNDALQ
jgi:hypothetical protein